MKPTTTTRPVVRAAAMVQLVTLVLVAACGGNRPPVARPAPPPAVPVPSTAVAPPPPAPPERVLEPTIIPPDPVPEDNVASASLDDLNRNSPLKPVFFDYDSSELTREGQVILDANSAILKRYPTWTVSLEGHCDERGTAEYNLALGERRAVAARAYLVSLGLPADRLRTVSYGKEFPFDPGHDDGAWSKNRRVHFVVTAK